MRRIIQLDPVLANQIAAGEVIERPASVIKELVENSLDAQASQIEIDLENGGMQLIRVRDDGLGILKEDLALAFSRHATSKITSVMDLAAIDSLGFRGEALASIACVAQCRLISRPRDQENAWQIHIAADLSTHLCPAAHPFGTSIEVKDLFYNTPARRKFLRSEKTELQAIEEMLRRLALSHPHVSFRLKHQQRQLRYYPKASANEQARIGQVCGQAFIEQAQKVNLNAVGLSLKGWVAAPQLARRQADCQYFFINGRMVKDRLLNHAIKTIYQAQSQLVEGTYPCYVLYLTIDPQEVDVNVHPTKQEVRFAHARLVHEFMLKGIEQALTDAGECQKEIVQPPKITYHKNQSSRKTEIHLNDDKPPVRMEQNPSATTQRYFFLEQEEGIIIIDLAKNSRALFQFYFHHYHTAIATKAVLFPIRLSLPNKLPPDDEILFKFTEVGFHIRQENNEWIFLHIPAVLNLPNKEHLLATILARSGHNVDQFLLQLCTLLPFNALHLLGDPSLSTLINRWLKESTEAQYIQLSHQQLEQFTLETSG